MNFSAQSKSEERRVQRNGPAPAFAMAEAS
jgi:hypothetical protein